MKKILFIILTVFAINSLYSQKVDSICFHLYTDSLKKGTHNYINVDGKLSNGKWIPLSDKEIQFSSSHGIFIHNDLVLPANFLEEKITVKASLKNNPAIQKEIIIRIKTIPDPVHLPSKDDIMNNSKPKNKDRKHN